ncbi:transporter [Lithospermum erythrorhizon]|uniref:Transporter n=1 Tax=Lithospermum erythrorhizon TaxID=34254 RepID=A0AAV3PNJ6_LITER
MGREVWSRAIGRWAVVNRAKQSGALGWWCACWVVGRGCYSWAKNGMDEEKAYSIVGADGLGVVWVGGPADLWAVNIVALVLANLIGGLFVLAQTLSNLKNGQQEENYREALGRKQRFLLHATIVMISYMVFGLVPPMVYGFTFHGTDDKDFKLLAVAVASLICIIFLAIGKAYIVQKAQQLHKFSTYFKHVVYYVATTAIVSGIGYVVGDQAKKILDHYGWMLPKDQASNTLFLHGS